MQGLARSVWRPWWDPLPHPEVKECEGLLGQPVWMLSICMLRRESDGRQGLKPHYWQPRRCGERCRAGFWAVEDHRSQTSTGSGVCSWDKEKAHAVLSSSGTQNLPFLLLVGPTHQCTNILVFLLPLKRNREIGHLLHMICSFSANISTNSSWQWWFWLVASLLSPLRSNVALLPGGTLST